MSRSQIDIHAYGKISLTHLRRVHRLNAGVMKKLATQIVDDVRRGKSLFVFGSGHSAIFSMELFHRAGGASFVIPLLSEKLLPSAGPKAVREFERKSGAANSLLAQAKPRKGEMLWIASQSGINPAGIDLALEARSCGIVTVAFTSIKHSKGVPARHPLKKKLFQVCDEVVDLSGFVGDASIPITPSLSTGPLSTLTSIFLGHSILTAAMVELESQGIRCVYTSVNTPEGEKRNRLLEEKAAKRDLLLR